LSDTFLSLDDTNFYQAQVFPSYPNAAVNCPRGPTACALPASWQQYATSEISAFVPDFKTPREQQAKSQSGTGTAGRVHGNAVLPVDGWGRHDSVARCESAATDLLQLSDLELGRQSRSESVL
jgi:hypothetical protein